MLPSSLRLSAMDTTCKETQEDSQSERKQNISLVSSLTFEYFSQGHGAPLSFFLTAPLFSRPRSTIERYNALHPSITQIPARRRKIVNRRPDPGDLQDFKADPRSGLTPNKVG